MNIISKLFGKNANQPVASSVAENTISQETKPNKIDVNKPVENTKLKALLEQWREQRTDDLLNQVFEEIVVQAHFLSVVIFSDELEPVCDGKVTLPQGTVIKFSMLTTQEGKSVYPAFTDWEELAKWSSITLPPQTLILSFDDYVSMVLPKEDVDGVVINPFGDNFMINRSFLEHLKTQKDLNTKGISQQVINQKTEVLLGEPKDYPTEMVAEISNFVKQKPEVQRIWLRLMVRKTEKSYLLVLDYTGDKDTLFGGIADAARPYLKGMYIDMISFQESFGMDAAKGVSPFYERK